MAEILNLQPQLLWKHFDEIRKIPHPSGNEKGVAEYVISVATRLGLNYHHDQTGNVVIYKSASKGHERAKPIILQGHLDMVAEKNSDKAFSFETDAIQLVKKDQWLQADGTTLGADNGVGVAAALAVLEDDSLVHGPIEALFTVDEERGLVGAMTISPDALKGRAMINLDSEELGVFSIGCAGGADSLITIPISRKNPRNDAIIDLRLYGLRGGHSGIDIHEGRGNAIKILNRLLYQVNKTIPLEIIEMHGGDKHNAIPREVFAKIIVQASKTNELQNWLKKAIEEIRTEFNPVEKDINLNIAKSTEKPAQVLDERSQSKIMAMLFALPHGPQTMSRQIKDLVETSNNVASIRFSDSTVHVHCSSRSSNKAAINAILDKLVAITRLAEGQIEQPNGYPGWMPNLDSEILKVSLKTYKQLTGKDAEYKAIHAGLECGIIGEKFPGMDMISMGPTIQHPHSPEERVDVESVKIFYQHLVKILEFVA
jgi:dipeptidase D